MGLSHMVSFRSPLVVTASEAVALLRQLEPRRAADLNERRFHYTAALVGAEQSAGVPGATALYDWMDVALVRFLLVLEDRQISRPVARAAATMIWPQVRAVLERGRVVAAVVVVPIADKPPWLRQPPVLTSLGDARKRQLRGVQVELREIVAGIPEGMARRRAEQKTVRMWAEVAPSTATTRLIELKQERQLVTL